jgi:hypothetical protein
MFLVRPSILYFLSNRKIFGGWNIKNALLILSIWFGDSQMVVRLNYSMGLRLVHSIYWAMIVD